MCVVDLIKINYPDITLLVDWAFKNNFFPCFIIQKSIDFYEKVLHVPCLLFFFSFSSPQLVKS